MLINFMHVVWFSHHKMLSFFNSSRSLSIAHSLLFGLEGILPSFLYFFWFGVKRISIPRLIRIITRIIILINIAVFYYYSFCFALFFLFYIIVSMCCSGWPLCNWDFRQSAWRIGRFCHPQCTPTRFCWYFLSLSFSLCLTHTHLITWVQRIRTW